MDPEPSLINPRLPRCRSYQILRTGCVMLAGILLAFFSTGCQSQSPRLHPQAIWDMRAGRYTSARAELRPHAWDERSPDFILDNLRLAVAALDDGAFLEARQALQRVYPTLIAGTVNSGDAGAAAFFSSEGKLVWRGEPFEQAMAWYYQAVAQLIAGDYENGRAASKNMLFTLVDFAGATTVDEAMALSDKPEWFDEHAEKTESDLVLGYLIEAICERVTHNDARAGELFDHAAKLRPDLAALIDTLRNGEYNTLLFVEVGDGPRKVPQGENGESFTFEPQPIAPPAGIEVTVYPEIAQHGAVITTGASSAQPIQETGPWPETVDTWALAQHPKWWSLKSLRDTKKALGDVLRVGGAGAIIYGATSRDANTKDKALGAGIAAMAVGELLAQGSAADLRSLDVLPRSVHIVPLNLPPGANTITIRPAGGSTLAGSIGDNAGHDWMSTGDIVVRHFIQPGKDQPAVYRIRIAPQAERRLNDPGKVNIERTDQVMVVHPNDVTGPIAGTYPFMMGGTDTCTPSRLTLDVYQQSGYLRGFTLEDLGNLYRSEGIVYAPQTPPTRDNQDTYRHILIGGRWLYTPIPGTLSFERMTFQQVPPYVPRSKALKDAIAIMKASGGIGD